MLSDSTACRVLGQDVVLSPETRGIAFAKGFEFNRTFEPSIFSDNLLRAMDIADVSALGHLAWWFFGFLLLIIAAFVIFNFIFKGFIRAAFVQQISASIISVNGSKTVIYALVILTFSLLVGLLALVLNMEFKLFDFGGGGIYVVAFVFVVSFSFLLLKIGFIRLLGFLTDMKMFYLTIASFMYSNLLIISLALIFILIDLASGVSESWFHLLLWITACFFALLYVFRLIKVFYISLIDKNGSIVNLFLYLCTVEFIPMFYAFGTAKLLAVNGVLVV